MTIQILVDEDGFYKMANDLLAANAEIATLQAIVDRQRDVLLDEFEYCLKTSNKDIGSPAAEGILIRAKESPALTATDMGEK